MIGDLFGKLKDMQQKVDEVKSQLDTVSVAGESPDGRVKVIATGNREIKSIKIDDDLRRDDPDELEDLLIIAINKTLKKAEDAHNAAVSEATDDLLPPHLMKMMNPSS